MDTRIEVRMASSMRSGRRPGWLTLLTSCSARVRSSRATSYSAATRTCTQSRSRSRGERRISRPQAAISWAWNQAGCCNSSVRAAAREFVGKPECALPRQARHSRRAPALGGPCRRHDERSDGNRAPGFIVVSPHPHIDTAPEPE